MKNVILSLFLALSLAACASAPKVVTQDDGTQVVTDPADAFLEKLGQFTKTDVEAAMRLAGDNDLDGVVDPDVQGDPVALLCYSYLNTKLGAAPKGIVVAGVISGFQAARNIKRRVDNGFSDEFNIGCGPLINDVRNGVISIGARLGSGGVLPF